MKKSFSIMMVLLLIAAVVFTGCPHPELTEKTDVEYVENVKKNLNINNTTVTGDFNLPASPDPKVTVTWTSSNTSVISISGNKATVTVPTTKETETVTLTAAIKKGSTSVTKTFTITVANAKWADILAAQQAAEAVAAVKQKLAVPETVQSSFTLPASSDSTVSITWSSSNTDIISISGNNATVTEVDKDTKVTITATITKLEARETKAFTVTVQPPDVAIQAVKAALTLESTLHKGNFTLPASSDSTVSITWTADKSAIVSINGTNATVTTPAEPTAVTLTATLKKGKASDVKTFNIIISLPDDGMVALAKNALNLERTVFAEDFDLPAVRYAEYGVTISWVSDKTAITFSNNKAVVNRPETTETVTLTATIKVGNESEEKKFTISVLGTTLSGDDICALAVSEVLAVIPATVNAPETGFWTLGTGPLLPDELTILNNEYTVSISYTSDDEIHFTSPSTMAGPEYWFRHDIVDVTVPLEVGVEIYNASDFYDDTVDVDITLKHITRLFHDGSETDPEDNDYGEVDTDEYLFDGSTLTYRSVYKPVNGTEQIREITIAYSAVPSSSSEGTMTATVTSITDDSKKSTSREQFASYCANKLSSLELEQATVIDTLVTMCTDGKEYTFSDYMEPFSSIYAQMGMQMTLAEFTDFFADEMYENLRFNSAEEFKNADSETLTHLFTGFVLGSITEMASMYGFTAPTSLEDWDDLYEQFKETVKTSYDEEMKKEAAQIFYSNVPFGYSISGKSDYDNTNTNIWGHASFLPGKPWYEQNGRFYKPSNGGDTTVEVTALGCEIKNYDKREIGTISQDYKTVTMEGGDKFTVSYNNNLNPPVLTLTADAGNKTFTDNYDLVLSASQLIPAIKFLEIF